MPVFPKTPEFSALSAAYDAARQEESDAIDAVVKAGDPAFSAEAKAAFYAGSMRMDRAHLRAMAIYEQMLALRLDK
jgi:hypothetical protein